MADKRITELGECSSMRIDETSNLSTGMTVLKIILGMEFVKINEKSL